MNYTLDTCNDPDCLECYGDPGEYHWIDGLTDEELDEVSRMNVDNWTTVGIVPCGNPACSSCYPPIAPDGQARAEVNAHLNRPSVDTSLSQEEQVREAHLLLDDYEAPLFDDETGFLLTVNGRMRECLADLWARAEIAEASSRDQSHSDDSPIADLRDELSYAWTQFWQLADELVTTEEKLTGWRERAMWLESALRNYAGDAWSSIKAAAGL